MTKQKEKQVYVASCIEHGDRFFTLFMSNETDKDLLYTFGIKEASEWGAECISVNKIEDTDVEYPTDDVYDADISDEENFKNTDQEEL